MKVSKLINYSTNMCQSCQDTRLNTKHPAHPMIVELIAQALLRDLYTQD